MFIDEGADEFEVAVVLLRVDLMTSRFHDMHLASGNGIDDLFRQRQGRQHIPVATDYASWMTDRAGGWSSSGR